MFTSMTARVSTNTYCIARTRRFSRRSENSVGRVTHEREAPTDIVQLVKLIKTIKCACKLFTVARFRVCNPTSTLSQHVI